MKRPWIPLLFCLAVPAMGTEQKSGPERWPDKLHYLKGLDPAGDNWIALKTQPDLRAERIAKLGPETLLRLLDSRAAWSRVRTENGQVGWILSRYLACCRTRTAERAAPPPPPPRRSGAEPAPALSVWSMTAEPSENVGRYETSLNDEHDTSAVLLICADGGLRTFFMVPFPAEAERSATYNVGLHLGQRELQATAALVNVRDGAGLFELGDRSPVEELARANASRFSLHVAGSGASATAQFTASNTREAAGKALSCGAR